MQIVAKVEKVQGWVGILALEKIGYSWRIKARVNGKVQTVAQSYYYTTDKGKAWRTLCDEYDNITGYKRDLFNL